MSDLARHMANRAELLVARAAAEAKWDAEMVALQARRLEHMIAFDQGLKDAEAVILAAGGFIPHQESDPEPMPVPDPVPEPDADA